MAEPIVSAIRWETRHLRTRIRAFADNVKRGRRRGVRTGAEPGRPDSRNWRGACTLRGWGAVVAFEVAWCWALVASGWRRHAYAGWDSTPIAGSWEGVVDAQSARRLLLGRVNNLPELVQA